MTRNECIVKAGADLPRRMFRGPSETMHATFVQWFAEHPRPYGREIGTLQPDKSWILYLKGRHDQISK
jgi:hypothetical protein